MIKNSEYPKIYQIAFLISMSCVLQISESLIPHPIPGLRLGLANIMTLVALVTLGFGVALEVSTLRTILSSFIMGTFMSPTFILSFSAALISTLIMGFLYWLSTLHQRYRFTIVGISILGALSHNLVQFYLAYFIFIRHKGIFIFLPWLCLGAVVMGWVTGLMAGSVCRRIKEIEGQETITHRAQGEYCVLELRDYSPGDSLIHRLGADIKIIGLFILSFTVLLTNNFWIYLFLILFLIMVVLVSKTSLNFIFSKIKKSASFIFVSFLFPLFFNSGKYVFSNMTYFKITFEGLNTGAIFAFRLLFLVMASSLLIRNTSPKELAEGMAKVLFPLRFVGISQKRIALIVSLSWMAIPVFWGIARKAIGTAEFKKVKNLRNLIPRLTDIIAEFYLEREKVYALWEAEYEKARLLRKEVEN